MKYLIKSFIILGIAVAAFTVIPVMDLMAAGPPGPPGAGGGNPPCWPAPCVPIDGGLGILLAAGLAYGGRKAYASFKERE